MPNRPEYLAIWLGITAVGGVVSLVNINLIGSSLAHCLNLVAPNHIIVAAELTKSFTSALSELNNKPTIWSHGMSDDNRFAGIEAEVEHYSGATLAAFERRNVTLNDHALYMYTSGTTGLPKAAIIDHRRLMGVSAALE